MQPSSSATLPRGFRFHYQDGERPSTPEATIQGELQAPAPPRPRLRVKRRNASNVSGPTEQFLASVAAAEVPLLSIQGLPASEDVKMLGSTADPVPDLERLVPRSADFRPSPLCTTTPNNLTSMDVISHHRRDWYWTSGSNLDDRPSSSLSYLSDSTDGSFFSNGQFPRPSEDGSCTSPDSDFLDPFVQSSDKTDPFVTQTSDKGKEPTSSGVLNGQIRSRTRHDAPWSNEMSVHLWQTYQVYLQDASVTPFRVGPAPPEGVVHRVAREAKRSWKGPRPLDVIQSREQRFPGLGVDASMSNTGNAGSPDTAMTESGSITPTANAAEAKVYLQWHHSGAATRSHLRELCRQNRIALSYRHLQSDIPTPFTGSHQFSVPSQIHCGSHGAYTQGAFSLAHMQNALPTAVTQNPNAQNSYLQNVASQYVYNAFTNAYDRDALSEYARNAAPQHATSQYARNVYSVDLMQDGLSTEENQNTGTHNALSAAYGQHALPQYAQKVDAQSVVAQSGDVQSADDQHVHAKNAFRTKEASISLATSSSDSMQPDGLSSKLAKPRLFSNDCQDDDLDHSFPTGQRAHRLGSPFAAQTYGPSSSKGFWKPSTAHGKSGTISTSRPYLGSPIRFNHHQSLNGSQKRRAQNPLEDEFPSRRALIRPSILDEQLFGTARDNQQRRVRSRGFSLGDESLGNRVPGLSHAQAHGASQTFNSGSRSASRPDTPLLPAFVFRATRPGTPGAVGGINFNTLPGRLPQHVAGASTSGPRAATVHHTRRSIESFDFGNGPSLQSRLAQLDEMLNEIRDREANGSK